ncbi:MAG: hypothetical protein ACREDC_07860 [Bradyrhizobium sp.]
MGKDVRDEVDEILQLDGDHVGIDCLCQSSRLESSVVSVIRPGADLPIGYPHFERKIVRLSTVSAGEEGAIAAISASAMRWDTASCAAHANLLSPASESRPAIGNFRAGQVIFRMLNICAPCLPAR